MKPTPNQVQQAKLQADWEIEISRQRDIVRAREYHEGHQLVALTERLLKFLGVGNNNKDDPNYVFRMNVCRSIVTAVSERMIVSGFDSSSDTVSEWAWETWQKARMDALQDEVHETSLRDGEGFVIVEWDADEKHTNFIPQERYTDVENGGDNSGCVMVYPDNDPNRKPLYAVKRWIEDLGAGDSRERKTVYYPDRIEKYFRDDKGDWAPLYESFLYDPDTGAPVLDATGMPVPDWPIDWTDAEGKPLGIAVKHFKNKGMRCEAWDGWPMQNAINKSLVDLLAAADSTAFRIYVARGFIPTSDGKEPAEDQSNWLDLQPGQIVGTEAPPSESSFDAIKGEDIKPLIDLNEQLVLWMAMVTDTPVNRFVSTRQIASDKTLKEQEGPLLAKVRNRKALFGNAWEDCMLLALKLENTFNDERADNLDEDATLETLWAQTQISGEKDLVEVLDIKKNKLKVPQDQVWKEAGYSQKQINQFMSSPEYKAALATLESIEEGRDGTEGQAGPESQDGGNRNPGNGNRGNTGNGNGNRNPGN